MTERINEKEYQKESFEVFMHALESIYQTLDDMEVKLLERDEYVADKIQPISDLLCRLEEVMQFVRNYYENTGSTPSLNYICEQMPDNNFISALREVFAEKMGTDIDFVEVEQMRTDFREAIGKRLTGKGN